GYADGQGVNAANPVAFANGNKRLKAPFRGAVRLEAEVLRHEPVPLECNEQDRRKGSGFGPVLFPQHPGFAGRGGALLLSGFSLSGDQRRWSGPATPLRTAAGKSGSLLAGSEPDVAAHPWRRRLRETGRGRSSDGDRLHPV